MLAQEGAQRHLSGWILLHNKPVLPKRQTKAILSQIHNTLHIGPRALFSFLSPVFFPLHLRQTIYAVHHSCLTCASTSPQGGLRPPQETHQLRGHQRENIKTCGGMVSHYCKSWGCVTSNDGYWKCLVTKPDLINMSFTGPLPESDWQGQPSNPMQCSDQVRLSFTQQGWTENRWVSGLSWGVVIHDTYGTGSNRATLYVQQVLQPTQTHAVGPNKAVAPPHPSPQGTNATNVVTSPTLPPLFS